MALLIAIAFVSSAADDSPNVKASSDSDALDKYFQAMSVAFASLKRFNPSARLLLVSNAEVVPRFSPYLSSSGVETVLQRFDHRPPPGFAETFIASLYMLDAVAALQRTASQDDTVVFVDPDVLCVQNLGKLVQHCEDRVGAYTMDFAPEYISNGLSAFAAQDLHLALDPALPDRLPVQVGGECFVFPSHALPRINQRVESAFQFSLERYEAGGPRFFTEEHMFTYALRDGYVDIGNYVRRIWTARRYRTVTGDENTLALWHLPAEKGRGFSTAFESLSQPSSWFWSDDAEVFREHASRIFGISRSTQRLLTDKAAAVALKLLSLIGRWARSRPHS